MLLCKPQCIRRAKGVTRCAWRSTRWRRRWWCLALLSIIRAASFRVTSTFLLLRFFLIVVLFIWITTILYDCKHGDTWYRLNFLLISPCTHVEILHGSILRTVFALLVLVILVLIPSPSPINHIEFGGVLWSHAHPLHPWPTLRPLTHLEPVDFGLVYFPSRLLLTTIRVGVRKRRG